MHFTKDRLQQEEHLKRLNMIYSISGIKSANLIGTLSGQGTPNLGIFSTVVHLGSDPALLAFVTPTNQEDRRNTYENILEKGYYTINMVHENFVERAHYTSARFEESVSEFERCRFTEEYLFAFEAPFVKESPLKLGMKFLEEVPIKTNDTTLVIGTIEHLIVPGDVLDDKGRIDLGRLGSVGTSGLDSYYRMEKIAHYPHAKPGELPDFEG